YGKFFEFLAGNDSGDSLTSAGTKKEELTAMRDLLRAEQDILIILSSDIRGTDIATIVKLGQSHHKVRFILLGDYANSLGAADMGLYPDLLPGYTPVANAGAYSEYGAD